MFYEAYRRINGYYGENYWESCGFFLSKEKARTITKEKYPKKKIKIVTRKFKDAV